MKYFLFLLVFCFAFSSQAQLLRINSKDSLNGKPKSTVYVKASVKLSGFVDFEGIPNESAVNLPSIPTERDSVTSDTQYNADLYQSRVALGSEIQTEKLGPIVGYIEGDFYGNGGGGFRLRHAYITMKNFRIGQSWSAFTDVDAWPNITDFDGPATGVWVRSAQISYRFDFKKDNALLVSIEKPTEDFSRYLEIDQFIQPANQSYPDFVAHYRKQWANGHFQVGGVARIIEYKNAQDVTNTVFGGGINLSGSVKPNGVDLFLWQAAAGSGIARYLVSFGGGGWDAIPNLQGGIDTVNTYGGFLSYQYYWGNKAKFSDGNQSKLSSTLVYGYVHLGNPLELPQDTLLTGSYASANLYWHLLPQLNFAFEGIYGYRTDEFGSSGDDVRLQFIMEYAF